MQLTEGFSESSVAAGSGEPCQASQTQQPTNDLKGDAFDALMHEAYIFHNRLAVDSRTPVAKRIPLPVDAAGALPRLWLVGSISAEDMLGNIMSGVTASKGDSRRLPESCYLSGWAYQS